MVEHINVDGVTLASVIRVGTPETTTFVTGPDSPQQVGFVVRAAGGTVAPHRHRPVERHLVGTAEVLVVREGCCELDVYDDDDHLVATRTLHTGDVALLVGGGHGLRMTERTVLMEIKQGPYLGPEEKVPLHPAKPAPAGPVPVNEPLLNGREAEYVNECLRTGNIAAGRFLDEFEETWAAYCGRRFGVAVCNGTAALQVAVGCLKLAPGDEVILPTFTIISCAQAIVAAGATPVLVDCDPRTWTMDVAQVAAKITPRTRAIMVVHMYGHPADTCALQSLANRHGLALIEDAAEAHGAECLAGRESPEPSWRRCGSFGALSCFSFYANKILTTGEGGMVLTDDPALAARARSLRNLCFRPDRRFLHDEMSSNFRLPNLLAAVGLAQLERIEETLERKRWMGREYTRQLTGVKGLRLPIEEPWARHVYWMYGVVLEPETRLDAATLATRLARAGVETRPFFLGMHEQPALQALGLFEGERYPVAEELSRRGLYLPSGVALRAEQLSRVCRAVREALP